MTQFDKNFLIFLSNLSHSHILNKPLDRKSRRLPVSFHMLTFDRFLSPLTLNLCMYISKFHLL